MYMINNNQSTKNNNGLNKKRNNLKLNCNSNSIKNIKNKYRTISKNKDLFMIISVVLSSIINIEFILPFWINLGYSKNICIQTIFITLIAFALYSLFNIFINNEVTIMYANKFIVIYILFLVSITFFKARTNTMSFTFNPLDSIYSLRYGTISSVINIVGNLLMYIPIGIYFRYKSIHKTSNLIISFIIYIFFIELIQGLSKTGTFDVNDIIMNTLGFTIGMKLISKY